VFPPVAAAEPPFGDEVVPPEATAPPLALVPPELALPPLPPAAPEDPGLSLHPAATTAKGMRSARRRADFCILFLRVDGIEADGTCRQPCLTDA